MANKQFGGSFAPPIDEAKLEEYRQLAGNVSDEQASDYMLQLVEMLDLFFETGDSSLQGSPHPSGVGSVVPLEDAEIKRIWDKVPWAADCDAMGKTFRKLQGVERNAAYHLLWYARELTQDREPMTTVRVGQPQ